MFNFSKKIENQKPERKEINPNDMSLGEKNTVLMRY